MVKSLIYLSVILVAIIPFSLKPIDSATAISTSTATVQSEMPRSPNKKTKSNIKDLVQKFSLEHLDETLKGNDPIFVEMTADWCITCKINHGTSINTQSTINVFKEHNVQYLLGDWTNQDTEITQYLEKFGRSGVPIYVVYGARDETGNRPTAKLLPQILTPNIVKNAFK